MTLRDLLRQLPFELGDPCLAARDLALDQLERALAPL